MMRDIILDVQSVGFGVQSTGIALMSGLGMIPRADKYYHSHLDEPQEVVDYIGYIMPILKDMGVDVEIIKPTSIYEHIMSWETADRISMIPVWFMGKDGKRQPLNRQCTSDFKIQVIAKKIREDLGVKRLQRNTIRIWQGISIDEIARAKKAALFPDAFRVNHFPLIGHYANITYPGHKWEDYSRHKIIENVFEKNGFKTPPKSACFFCPFHDIEYWYHIYNTSPLQWEAACKLDDSIRNYNTPSGVLTSGPFFLYVGLIPLREIDFDKERSKFRANNPYGCESGFCFV